MNFYRYLCLKKVVLLLLNFLALWNLASHYMTWTSKETLALQKLYCCFLLEFLRRTLDMVVLEESFLGLRFSTKFLADFLKMSSGLLKCFVFVLFCIFFLPNSLENVLEPFSHSSSHLILTQVFAPFDCLSFPV